MQRARVEAVGVCKGRPQISRLGRGLAKSDDLDALPVAIAAGEVDSRFADGRK